MYEVSVFTYKGNTCGQQQYSDQQFEDLLVRILLLAACISFVSKHKHLIQNLDHDVML